MTLIHAEHLYKRFLVHEGARDLLAALLGGRLQRRAALDDVSMQLRPGEIIGVVGANGSGKSTLLKVLAGVQLPERGTVRTAGRIIGLLELGTGFRAELTGLENLEINALLLGMSARQVRERRAAIIDFSGLGKAIREPLKNYSSGMRMRLGFAIAVHADADALLLDEVLAVGDAGFQQRCIEHLTGFTRRGGGIILVAHDIGTVRALCDRAILLHHGRIAAEGAAADVAAEYNRVLADEPPLHAADEGAATAFGTFEATFAAVGFHGLESGGARVRPGEPCRLQLEIHARVELAEVTVGFLIRDRFGHEVFGTNTALMGRPLALAAGERRCLTFELDMNLGPGAYTIALALHTGRTHEERCYEWREHASGFEVVVDDVTFIGVARLQPVLHMDAATDARPDAADCDPAAGVGTPR